MFTGCVEQRGSQCGGSGGSGFRAWPWPRILCGATDGRPHSAGREATLSDPVLQNHYDGSVRRFLLKNLDPGKYKLFAWEKIEYGAFMDRDFVAPVEDSGRALTIKENSHERAEFNSGRGVAKVRTQSATVLNAEGICSSPEN
jgi:hypothetical protein